MASSSPYLRQHAHNPVYWYPWGKGAIERARAENKPIFLSIGYSTCYWCHVMEREVFDNVSIAAQMNEHFVNVKVDREEMPELDEIYMIARTLMTKQGGWPNNLFLTPDLKPFYAIGTAGPADANGRPGFPRILEWINYIWQTQQEETRKNADELSQAMQGFLVATGNEVEKPMPLIAQAHKLIDYLTDVHDDRSGGFFQAPKFPHESNLLFLMEYYKQTAFHPALEMAQFSLAKMSAGGINDQVGGGFHRYDVDKEWYVPHFEKMLYNQALISRSLLEAYRYTKEPFFADMARSTLDYVYGPMSQPEGGFYAAFDAEVQGVEGAYYAWEAEEIKSVLDADETTFFTRFFALAQIPHFPGHPKPKGQAVIMRQPLHIAAAEAKMPYLQALGLSALVLNKLLEVRNTRESPRRDDKIITGWNGLMIDACAIAGQLLEEPRYTEMAKKTARFILHNVTDLNGNLRRIWINGKAEHKARLEDYAYLIRGLLSLYRTTQEDEWKQAALDLMQSADKLFCSKQGEGWFTTEEDDLLLIRVKTADDNALPSANGMMLHNLIDFYELTGEDRWLKRARKEAEFFSHLTHRILVESATLLSAYLRIEAIEAAVKKPVPEGLRLASLGEGAHRVMLGANLLPSVPFPGSVCDVVIGLTVQPGWFIQRHDSKDANLVATSVDIRGEGVEEVLEIAFQKTEDAKLSGTVTVVGKIKISEKFAVGQGTIKIAVRFQPCSDEVCMPVADIVVAI